MPDAAKVLTQREPDTNLEQSAERLLRWIVKGRWWIIGATCVIPILAVATALKLPNQYVSTATLLVVQQQVSQRYVEPDSATSAPASVEAMKLEVLSRDRLLGIINDLNLYDMATTHVAPEVLVDRMRKDIEVLPIETNFSAFTVAFQAPSPRIAQEVASRLTSLFIEQNFKTRGERAANTNKFLSDQLENAKQKLEEQEHRLQAFKASNLNELPEQQQATLAALTDIRLRLEALASNLSQARQLQSSLELSLNDRLTRLRSERTTLLTHYTSRYPEVLKKDEEIDKVQTAIDRLKIGAGIVPKAGDSQSVDDPSLELILRQAETNAVETTNLAREQAKLTGETEQYQKRLSVTPLREQQLSEIMRDYNLYKQDYTDLSNKKLQSQMTATLEENQEGQQFRLVDPPSLPAKPTNSKRVKIALGGLAAGVLTGLALAFLLDLRDSSFHSEKSVSLVFSLPFVLGVPLVRTPIEQRSYRWKVAIEWLLGGVMTVAMCAAELYVLKNG